MEHELIRREETGELEITVQVGVRRGPEMRAETHAMLLNALEKERPDAELFGAPSRRALYVSYETGARFVGIVLDPAWATHADSLAELEAKMRRHVAAVQGVDESEVVLFGRGIEEQHAGEAIVGTAADR